MASFVSSSKPFVSSWRSRNPNHAASDSRSKESKAAHIRLTQQEKVGVVAKCDHLTMLKYSPARPGAFTEHGRSTSQRGLVEEFWKVVNMTTKRTVPIEIVIVVVREHRGILSADLARIYGVETRVLNQAVKRNLEKFPGDFIFRLTREEAETLSRSRSQSVILNAEAEHQIFALSPWSQLRRFG